MTPNSPLIIALFEALHLVFKPGVESNSAPITKSKVVSRIEVGTASRDS